MENELPVSVLSFIDLYIASVEELEIMLLLQEDPNRCWTAAAIDVRLRSQESSIAKWLEALSACGLASGSDGRYRFAPRSSDLNRSACALAEAYRERRVQVIEFIFSKSNESVLSFVRAFDPRDQKQS